MSVCLQFRTLKLSNIRQLGFQIIATDCKKAPLIKDIKMVNMIPIGNPGFEAIEKNFNYDNSVYVKRDLQ